MCSLIFQKITQASKLSSIYRVSSMIIILIDWIPQFSFLMRFFCHCKSSYHIEGMMRGQLQVCSKASIVTWSKSFTINCNYPASTQNRNTTKSSPELVNNLHLHSIKTLKKGDAFDETTLSFFFYQKIVINLESKASCYSN